MTLSGIYDKVVWYYFGSSTPQASVVAQFQAVGEGVVANLHRKIQEDFNYWFMEASYMVNVPAFTRQVALPANFKCEIDPIRILRFSSASDTGTATCTATTAVVGSGTAWETNWSGRGYQITWDDVTYYTILSVTDSTNLTLASVGPNISATYTIRKTSGSISLRKLTEDSAYRSAQDINGTGTYPLYYDIFENYINLYPLFSEDVCLMMRYYTYLARPTNFTSHTDAITTEAADLLTYLSVAELCTALDNTKYTLFMQKSADEIALLKKKHHQRVEAGLTSPLFRSTPAKLSKVIYD